MAISKDELVDDHVSLQQCTKAVDALLTYERKRAEKRQENELLELKEPHIWLNVTVKKMAPTYKIKPAKIPIVHPLVDPRTTPVCLITKDPQREYKDLLETHKIKFIHRVVGIEKLKGKWKPFEARRMLLKENGLFLADERIIPLLPKLLGKKWFDAKKQPIPVSLTRKDLKGELERAVSSTYMHQNKGTCTSIKVGVLSQTTEQIVANIQTALPAIVKRIQDGWENIQNLNVKTSSSMSLPIWSCSLGDDEGGRWDGFTAKSDAEDSGSDKSEDEGSEDAVMEEEPSPPPKSKSKGKKRTSEDQDPADSPKKRAKNEVGKPISTKPAPQTSSKATSTDKPSTRSNGKLVPPSASKKPKISSTSVDPVPAVTSPASKAPSNESKPKAVKEKKKDKSTSSESLPNPITSPSQPEITTNTKLTKKKKQPSSEVTQPSGTPPAPPPKSSSGPSKDLVTAVPKDAPKKESKSKSKSSASVNENADSSSAKKTKTQPKAAPPSTAEQPITASIITKPTISAKELKQKRGAGGVEKKKEKLNKVGGKSAKDGILGKKASRV